MNTGLYSHQTHNISVNLIPWTKHDAISENNLKRSIPFDPRVERLYFLFFNIMNLSSLTAVSFGDNLIVLKLCPELKAEFLIDLLCPLFLLSETELALQKLIRESVRGETGKKF